MDASKSALQTARAGMRAEVECCLLQVSPRDFTSLPGICKADAISASGRLASAPTRPYFVKHPVYATNLHFHHWQQTVMVSYNHPPVAQSFQDFARPRCKKTVPPLAALF